MAVPARRLGIEDETQPEREIGSCLVVVVVGGEGRSGWCLRLETQLSIEQMKAE